LLDQPNGIHLAPTSNGLAQVAPGFKRLLDGEALRQVRGYAAMLQLSPDSGGPFRHFFS
jgi:hypothetical protein